VSEIAGRIPLPGEVLELKSIGLRLEVVASTSHKVERVRVFPPTEPQPDSEKKSD
jgi:hypothetical protein